MALDPQSKSVLEKFTLVAKKIIYNHERMQAFMQMLGTPEGAITAVQSVIAAMEKRKAVPPQILPLLGVNIYMAMVDVAQASTDVKADPGVMRKVIDAILSKVGGSVQSEAPKQPQQNQGATSNGQSLLASMKGAPA